MSRRVGQEIERLDVSVQTAIIKTIIQRIDKEAEVNDETTSRLYDAYLKKYRRRWQSPRDRPKSITYDTLPEILYVAQMSIADMYAAVGVTVEWASADMKAVAELCAKLDGKKYAKCFRLAMELSPSFWQTEAEYTKTCPSIRIMNLMRRRYSYEDRLLIMDNVDPELSEFWKKDIRRNGGFTSIPTLNLPSVAKAMGVSLHWLMKQDSAITAKHSETEEPTRLTNTMIYRLHKRKQSTVLAENYGIEMIVTAYSFMPESAKKSFKALLEELCREELRT